MGKKYTLIKRPPLWVSAHRECRLKYAFATGKLIAVGSTAGNLVMGFSSLPFTPLAGERIYVYPSATYSNLYTGYHLIKQVLYPNILIMETPYQGYVDVDHDAAVIRLPEISIYKGYAPAEIELQVFGSPNVDMYTLQPRALVATFKPEANPEGYMEFDISGYLKTVIPQPYKCGYNDTENNEQPNLFLFIDYIPQNYGRVQIMLKVPGETIANKECELLVANSAITTPELNRFFVDTNRPLGPMLKPVHFNNGVNHYDYVSSILQLRIKT